MKKTILKTLCSFLLAVATLLSVVYFSGGCDNQPDPVTEEQKKRYTKYEFAYFDTVTTLTGYASSGDEFEKICEDVLELLSEYHQLFDIYNRYPGKENLYTINKLYDGEHKEVKVDKKIIDMLLYAKKMYEISNGKKS